MNAVIYILVRKYANSIKRVFSKPLSAILTIFAIASILSGPVLFVFIPFKGIVVDQSREIVIAGMQLFVGITFIASALSQQGALFTSSEAFLLFCAPFTKKTILLYSTLQTGPVSIITAVFMCFYYPFFIGSVMTPLKLLASILVTSLMFFCIYIIYYYIYIQDIAYPGLKKRLMKVLWPFLAAPALVFAAMWIFNGRDIKAAAIAFFTSHIYHAFPVLGWAKWAISALLNDNYINGFIPAILLLTGLSCVLARLYYSLDVDFYEKAQLDSIRIQQLVDNIKKSGYVVSGMSINKVRKVESCFRPGAAAIMSRQLLEMKKKGPVIFVKELLNGGIYLIIGLAIGQSFEFVFSMVLFALIMGTTSDSWHSEFNRPYVYLIPESSFKKVVFIVIPSFVKTFLSGLVVVTAAAAVYKIEILPAINYLLMMGTYTLLFITAGVFTYRILGRLTNAIVLIFLRMLIMILSAIPGGILAVILHIASDRPNLSVTSAAMALVNVAVALLLLFLSRRLFEQSELMN